MTAFAVDQLVDGRIAVMHHSNMSEPAAKRPAATRADLERLPANVLGEIIDGVLYTFPRPRPPHARAIGKIVADLDAPYDRARSGPGGWWILPEPGVELADSPEVVPDVAGWRRERMPDLPTGAITLAPDWACEILSPSTRQHDHRIKRPFYARVGVQYLWFVDLDAQTLSVSRLERGRWVELGVWGDNDRVHAEPFGDVEIALADWWPAPAQAAAP